MQKKCCKCKELKPMEKFGKLSSSPDGLRYDCKDCRHQYNVLNRNKRREYNKSYWIENSSTIKKKNKLYRDTNKDKISNQRKEYRSRSHVKEHIRKKNQEYLPKRKEKIRIRRKEDVNFRLSEVLRSKIHKMISGKETSYKTLIGCDSETFKKWIEFQWESWMNWDNYGKMWHIDHIIPIDAFDLSKQSDKKVCFHWRNLQPLDAFENQSKSNKILFNHIDKNRHLVKKFVKVFHKLEITGHQALSEMEEWLRENLRYGNSSQDECSTQEMDNPHPRV